MLRFGKWALAGLSALSLVACSGADKAEQAQQNGGATSAAVPAPAATNQGVQTVTRGEVAKTFAFTDFSGLVLTSADDVRVRQGQEFLIRAVGQAADIGQLSFMMDNGQLVIGRQSTSNRMQDVDIEVVMPTVNRLTVSGSGDMKVEQLNGERAMLVVTGSGDLDVNGGKVRSADLRLTGSGKIDTEKMQTETLNIASSGSGDIDAFASRSAAITLSGSGDVEVKGGATCRISKSGSGKAECK